MNNLELIGLLHENGIDITNSFISVRQIVDGKICEEDTVLVTNERGSIRKQFTNEELFPENAEQRVPNTSKVVEQQIKAQLPPILSLAELAVPERVSSQTLSRGVETSSTTSKTEERLGSSRRNTAVRNSSAKQHEIRKRKLSPSDDDWSFVGSGNDDNSFEPTSQRSASKRHKGMGDQITTFQDKIGETIFTYPNKVHDYLKGDFVVERADTYKMDIVQIWKISGNNMLERYDAIEEEANVYKTSNRFTRVKDNLNSHYTAIQVRKRDDKNVIFKNRISPEALDESLDGMPIMEVFSVYVQSIVGQCLSRDFFRTITSENSKYFLESINQIDSILQDAQDGVTANTQWVPHFKEALDQCPYYSVSELIQSSPEHLDICQVSNDSTITATKCFNLHGLQYLKGTLRTISRRRNFTFFLSDSAMTMAMNYHAARHYKFHLFKDSEKEVALRQISNNSSEVDILNEVMNNRPRTRQFYGHLMKILTSCGLDVVVGQR